MKSDFLFLILIKPLFTDVINFYMVTKRGDTLYTVFFLFTLLTVACLVHSCVLRDNTSSRCSENVCQLRELWPQKLFSGCIERVLGDRRIIIDMIIPSLDVQLSQRLPTPSVEGLVYDAWFQRRRYTH